MFLNPDTGLVTTTRSGTSVVYRHPAARRPHRQRRGGWSLVPVAPCPWRATCAAWCPARCRPPGRPRPSRPRPSRRGPSPSTTAGTRRSRRTGTTCTTTRAARSSAAPRSGSTSQRGPQSDAASPPPHRLPRGYRLDRAFTQFSSSERRVDLRGEPALPEGQARPLGRGVGQPEPHLDRHGVRQGTLEASYPSIGSYLKMRVTRRNGEGRRRVGGARDPHGSGDGERGSLAVLPWAARREVQLVRAHELGLGPSYFPRDVTSTAGAGRARRGGEHRRAAGVLRQRHWRLEWGEGPGGERVERLGQGAHRRHLGHADAVSDVLVQGRDGTLYLRRGNGDGTFAAGVKIGIGWQSTNLVFPVGDFDGDGHTDLMARRASDGALVLYSGNGTGASAASGGGRRRGNVFSAVLQLRRLRRRRRADVLARTAAAACTSTPATAPEGGSREPPRRLEGLGGVFTAVTSRGDFDGDGRADVPGPDLVRPALPSTRQRHRGWKTRRAAAKAGRSSRSCSCSRAPPRGAAPRRQEGAAVPG